jgi:hypothetical protein
VLTNSSRKTITNSHFVNIENTQAWRGYIHGVYVTHFSSSNEITANRMTYIGGNPVKTRDRSSSTTSRRTRSPELATRRSTGTISAPCLRGGEQT